MRTFEEISVDIQEAISACDVESLKILADEMMTLESSEARAEATVARAFVEYRTGNPEHSLEELKGALSMYTELGNVSAGAKVHHNIALVLMNTDRRSSALDHFNSALMMYSQLGSTLKVASVNRNIGRLHQITGHDSLALEHFRRALSIFEEHGTQQDILHVLSSMGTSHFNRDEYNEALTCFEKSLALCESIGDQTYLPTLIGNMGNVYCHTGQYPLALQSFRRALALHETQDTKNGAALVIGNLGNLYSLVGDTETALEHYLRALSAHRELGNHNSVAVCTLNLGLLYQTKREYTVALNFLNQALLLFVSQDNHAQAERVGVCRVSVLLGMQDYDEAEQQMKKLTISTSSSPATRSLHVINMALLSEYHGDLDSARKQLLVAKTLAETANLREYTADCCRHLRDLSAKQNDLAAYIEHNDEYQRITEEIHGKEATQRLAMIEAERKIEAELRERDKERALLYGALPETVAKRMLRGEEVTGDYSEYASVIFLDIVGFTAISDRIPPGHVVHLLSQIFSALDDVCKRHGVTKIKTIGDSYMAVSGVPEVHVDHAQRAARVAVEMLKTLDQLSITQPPGQEDTSWTRYGGTIQVRIGMHSGPVTAGVIGTERLQYDVWGDTVNVASRMESTSEPGRIQVSEAFANSLGPHAPMPLTPRGTIDIKGKGLMHTFWLET